jgi:hypothetical protein
VSKGMVSQYKNLFPELDYKCVYNIVDTYSSNKAKEIKTVKLQSITGEY